MREVLKKAVDPSDEVVESVKGGESIDIVNDEDDEEKLAREREFKKFTAAIGDEGDPTMLILRAHLFSESLLERYITFKFPRGDKVIENAALSFHQKLIIVDAFDELGDHIISSLRNLNKLRNQCAHQLDKRISDGDVLKVGSPLGTMFTRLRREANFDEIILLRSIINYICGYLTGHCHCYENSTSQKSGK
ncbi:MULTISPECIES: hypothetical protein [unclassified Janthinobacterium]|uniref:hypothetical protein n=1 Tax=unclassified Janthinobacterium TaxID=2610881 RepID=UPI00088C815B|nr:MULTISPECIES: hypothetical protein [unclassified Janthinobacterium]SDA57287.1 hypothetical protein SAMN03159349_02088 [Janthinobacterium sp. 551a]SFB27886.1 hypothetical protein SAMN03159300_10393 [Janthinobacterium sp. 344]